MTDQRQRRRVFGIGLNRTGTKTLARHLRNWGYRHRTYDSDTVHTSPSFDLLQAGRIDELLAIAEAHDSAEDWPWPLLYRELDGRFPDARFVLTRRRSADVWYRSLCNMAVRIGPLPLFERRVYGSSMPQGAGRRARHVAVYEDHNAAVRRHFAGREGKLLELCWEEGDGLERLAAFLGEDPSASAESHVNRSPEKVYDGDSLVRAHAARLDYQYLRGPDALLRRALARAGRLLGRR